MRLHLLYKSWQTRRTVLMAFTLLAFLAWHASRESSPDGGKEAPSGCHFPKLDLHNPEIHRLHKKVAKPVCAREGETNWIGVEKGRLVVSKEAKRRYGNISCTYKPFERKNDYEVRWLNRTENAPDGFRLQSDFFGAECRSSKGNKKFEILDAGIAPIAELEAPNVERPSSTSPLFGLNVLVLALDSVSRLAFMRTLPKCYEYLTATLGAVVLKGYNIVGDATPQALIPILTGKTEKELPLTRKRFKQASYVDVYPMIWKDFKTAGYATLYAEDSVHIGTFLYRLKGFDRQPTHHYLQTFYVEMPKRSADCHGYRVAYEYYFDYIRHFMDAYPRRSKFAFSITDISHNDPSSASMIDDDLLAHLRYYAHSGILNETILIVMADHGLRYGEFRGTQQARLEERMPFVSITLPPRIRTANPRIVRLFEANANRLSTPFDLHFTLRSVLNFSNESPASLLEHRGISLLESEVPLQRGCEHAGIEPHWCTCLDWKKITANTDKRELVMRLAKTLVDRINEATESERSNCVEFRLKEVSLVLEFAPKSAVLGYRKAKDLDGFVPDLSGKMNATSLLYQLSVIVSPGGNRYEATIEYESAKNAIRKPKIEEVSITNAYGDKPHCVLARNAFLAKFCVCPDRV